MQLFKFQYPGQFTIEFYIVDGRTFTKYKLGTPRATPGWVGHGQPLSWVLENFIFRPTYFGGIANFLLAQAPKSLFRGQLKKKKKNQYKFGSWDALEKI